MGSLHGAHVLGCAVQLLQGHVRRLQAAVRRTLSMEKWIVHVAGNDLAPIGPDGLRVDTWGHLDTGATTLDVPEKRGRSAGLAHDDAESSPSVPHVLASPPRSPSRMRRGPPGRVRVAPDLRRV